MGEVDYAPGEPRGADGTRTGFEAITYMIHRVFGHQDSNGGWAHHCWRHPVDDG
jgi:hypothetical protein